MRAAGLRINNRGDAYRQLCAAAPRMGASASKDDVACGNTTLLEALKALSAQADRGESNLRVVTSRVYGGKHFVFLGEEHLTLNPLLSTQDDLAELQSKVLPTFRFLAQLCKCVDDTQVFLEYPHAARTNLRGKRGPMDLLPDYAGASAEDRMGAVMEALISQDPDYHKRFTDADGRPVFESSGLLKGSVSMLTSIDFLNSLLTHVGRSVNVLGAEADPCPRIKLHAVDIRDVSKILDGRIIDDTAYVAELREHMRAVYAPAIRKLVQKQIDKIDAAGHREYLAALLDRCSEGPLGIARKFEPFVATNGTKIPVPPAAAEILGWMFDWMDLYTACRMVKMDGAVSVVYTGFLHARAVHDIIRAVHSSAHRVGPLQVAGAPTKEYVAAAAAPAAGAVPVARVLSSRRRRRSAAAGGKRRKRSSAAR